MVIVSFKPYILKNYNAFSSASESNKRNPRDRTFNLPSSFCFKYITSLKNHLSLAQGESLPYRFQGKFFGHVCELPLPAVANRIEMRCQLRQLLLLYFKICLC